jgi:OOP family OmpA-OmpF porin
MRVSPQLAKLLLTEPTMRLSVEAHTDATGEAADNVVLSNARAAAVVAHLEGLGVEAARLTPHGFGQAFPCDDNGTEAGRQRNRRVEFVVIPDVATLKPK